MAIFYMSTSTRTALGYVYGGLVIFLAQFNYLTFGELVRLLV